MLDNNEKNYEILNPFKKIKIKKVLTEEIKTLDNKV